MGCACKVNQHITNITKQYGTSKTIKTNIKDKVNLWFKKLFIGLICVPFLPLMVIYLIVRKCITNKPILINRFIKRTKNVRN